VPFHIPTAHDVEGIMTVYDPLLRESWPTDYDTIHTIAFSTFGTSIASSCDKTSVPSISALAMTDIAANSSEARHWAQARRVLPLPSRSEAVHHIAYSDHEGYKYLAAASQDHAIVVWRGSYYCKTLEPYKLINDSTVDRTVAALQFSSGVIPPSTYRTLGERPALVVVYYSSTKGYCLHKYDLFTGQEISIPVTLSSDTTDNLLVDISNYESGCVVFATPGGSVAHTIHLESRSYADAALLTNDIDNRTHADTVKLNSNIQHWHLSVSMYGKRHCCRKLIPTSSY
jgi:hypothetical protein